jgi:threonine dehydrogenase-like Zn-dependent dehydrogenase
MKTKKRATNIKRMKAIRLFMDWEPREGFKLGPRDIERRRAQEGNKVWRNPRVKIVTDPLPKIKPYEVLIKVRACGICGSDVLMAKKDLEGYTSYGYIMANGVIIGHEFAGDIVEMGKKVKNLQKRLKRKKKFNIGTPVTAQCVIPCGSCQMCKDKKPDLCFLNEERGFSKDGAMAEYVVADIKEVYSIESYRKRYGKDMYLVGALTEPLAGVYKAIVEVGGGLRPGENGVVIGGGPIGFSAIGVLKALGAGKVILSEPLKHRREKGRLMGADYLIDPLKENLKEKILEYTKGKGARIYFEAAGVAPKVYSDIEKLFQIGRPESKLILFGHGPGKIEINPEVFIGNYNVITGSHGHCGVWDDVIRMVSQGIIDPRKMITHKISLDQVPDYLKKLQKPTTEGKVVITKFK